MIAALTFYGFALMALFGGTLVIFTKNPVRSALALMFCFFNSAGLILISGAEYIAATLVIVYVGAVVILFLFIVMTLSTEMQMHSKRLTIITIPLFLAFASAVISSIYLLDSDIVLLDNERLSATNTSDTTTTNMTNAQHIGMVLYTRYFLQFQLAGMILLVALIGVITLSKRSKQHNMKKQNLWDQITVDPKTRLTLVQKKSGEGVEI